ncbi:MAG: c-type cytochrome domain-containing protein [Isosphaerales bacterium]
MRSKLAIVVISGLVYPFLGVVSVGLAADPPKSKVTYQDNVSQVFRSRCGTCHNPDKQKGGLNLDNYGSAMQGGGSGKVIEPGNAENSQLFLSVSHREEPKMPPNSPKIPDGEIELIRKWIEGGALENSGSALTVKAKPKFEFKLDPAALGKPAGTPAMPEKLSTEPFVPQAKASAVVAMSASPWAPLIAIAGHKQVLLYRTTDYHLVGVLPFPEGTIYVLKFSRNGDLLLAGGGRGGQSGIAVGWDVKKGSRVFEVGKEYDVVLAADISPDHGQVALGGPSRVVRVYNTADGSLAQEMRKHTEWITAAEFSPDGVLLATGDRNNGLVVWEAQTGREFFDLRGHQAAITDISWRLDSNVVASSSEDGTVRLWEMENGGNIKTFGAHGGGVASVRFAKDGRLLTTGRDRMVRVWDQNGGKQREFEPFGDLALEAVFSHDESKVVAADWTGEIRVWDIKDGRRLANLAVNPAPVAIRIEHVKQALAAAQAEAGSLTKQLVPFQNAIAPADAALAQASGKLAAAEQGTARQTGLVQQFEQALKVKLAATEEARTTLQAAEQLAAQTAAAQATAEKAIAQSGLAEKTASDSLAATRTATEKALAGKTAHDPALTAATGAFKAAATPEAASKASAELAKQAQKAVDLVQALASAGSRQAAAAQALAQATAAKNAAPQTAATASSTAKAATLGVHSARDAFNHAGQDKAAVDKALADARSALQTATAALTAVKKEHAQASAAKAGAAKALAEKRAPLDAALARAQALKAEVDALAVERNRFGATKGGLASAARPGS